MRVDLGAISRNVATIRRTIGASTRIMAVLKGNAYGMGAAAIARHVETVGIGHLATDNAAEAIALREQGVGARITVLYGGPPSEAHVYFEQDLIPTLYDEQQLAVCVAACEKRESELEVWLGTNLGFNRAGSRDSTGFEELLFAAREAASLRVVGVLAHMTSSHTKSNLNSDQMTAYGRRVELARQRLGNELETSLFASHGLLRWAEQHQTDWVRPGLLLGGEQCFTSAVLRDDPNLRSLLDELQPAIDIHARVIHVLDVKAGESLGYAEDEPLSKPRRLATVALGFQSGYPVEHDLALASHGGHRRISRVGQMGMDSLQLDVSDVDEISVGDWITLVGGEGPARVSIAEVCAAARITPYELLGRLRLPQAYQ